MPPRYVCPSMGAMRRPILKDAAVISNCCSRGFRASAHRAEERSGGASTPPPALSGDRPPRRVLNTRAASELTSLQNRRPLPRSAGLAGGSFPSGRSSRESEDSSNSSTPTSSAGSKLLTPRKPLNISRQMVGPAGPRSGGGAPGTRMARAPSQLRVNAPGTKRNGGPNLRGRGKGGKAGNRAGAGGPKARGGKGGGKSGPDATRLGNDATMENGLSDGMVQHLLRLQRKEWDRVPYEPKYTPGSFAANELIHAGRELFRGEAPPVKVWGHLEQKLCIVGMHGAAANLQVRRVPAQEMTTGEERKMYSELGIQKRQPSLPKPAKERTLEIAEPKESKAKEKLEA
ncbi:hypothetical protein K458DRAFT_342181 [Lentithecium fluviatile CBS 122367]|uniref:Uncharacterized protein n=1 Tax=Lentithecium fluviatile CBS 122367 TaxID=1168545 RepID=A0A6G1IX97_9PLEO|nr:hypothetical protein K458DRAFT_342181 [Lentithecium fluviatile CBS 122367]